MKKKLISVFMSLIIGIFVLTGCNAGSIEGTWVLYEEIEPSGNKLSQSDLEELGISETYVIKGDTMTYEVGEEGNTSTMIFKKQK